MIRALLFCLLSTGVAVDPIDEQLAKLTAARKAKADAEKSIAEIETSLRTMLAEIQKKLSDAGVITPLPPPPAPEPKPVDPLKAKLKAAFDADSSTSTDVLKLAVLYRKAANLARDKTKVLTTAELLQRVRDVGEGLVGPDVLVKVRKLAGTELLAALGKSDDTPITDDERKAAADVFTRLAAILEEF